MGFPYGNIEKKGKKKNFKYCINYKIDGEVKPSCIRFPKMSGYLNGLKENKYMNFLIKADQVSKQYNKIQDRIGKSMGIEFNSQPVNSQHILNTTIKLDGGKINTGRFSRQEIHNQCSSYACQ